MTTGVRRQASTAKEVPSVTAVTARAASKPSRSTRVRGEDKRSVIASVAAALKDGNFPSMDERLKNMVASQVGDLLRGGFKLDDIRYAAVELGLSWDQKRGHNRLCHLAARVRSEFWAEEFADHALRMVNSREAEPLGVEHIAGKPHPNQHPYTRGEIRGDCGLCGGPIGVHVRKAVEV